MFRTVGGTIMITPFLYANGMSKAADIMGSVFISGRSDGMTLS